MFKYLLVLKEEIIQLLLHFSAISLIPKSKIVLPTGQEFYMKIVKVKNLLLLFRPKIKIRKTEVLDPMNL